MNRRCQNRRIYLQNHFVFRISIIEMVRKLGHLGICLLGLVFCQCAREVYIELPDEQPKVVVNGHFTVGAPFRVHVSKSQEIHETDDPVIPEVATINLSAEGQVVEQLHLVKDPVNDELYWESFTIAQGNKPYSLTINVPDLPTATASSAVPKHIALEPVVLNPDSFRIEPLTPRLSRLRIPITLEVPEMPALERYFGFYFRHEVIRYEDTTFQAIDQEYEVSGTPFLTDGSTFSLLYSLTEPTVLIQEKYWNQDRRKLELDVLIAFEPPLERPSKLLVEWRTLSPEFYHYHLSVARQSGSPALSDPDALYNHVFGGYGNFSGYSIAVDTLLIPW